MNGRKCPELRSPFIIEARVASSTMATQPSDLDGVTEQCSDCASETIHKVRVELRTESSKEENAEFSREPYRVTTCQECKRETIQRMNNA